VVAVMLPNRVELLLTLFAAWRLGDLALLIYTSGSTGGPKGAMLDHATLVAMGASIGEAMKLSSDDSCLLVLPLFHVNAILVSCLAPMMAGAQVTILARFAPDAFLAAISRYRATYFSAVPAIYARLAELPGDQLSDTSSVRLAVCGAAPVSRETAAPQRGQVRLPDHRGVRADRRHLPAVAHSAAEKVAMLVIRAGCLVPGTRRRRRPQSSRVRRRSGADHGQGRVRRSRAHPARQIGRARSRHRKRAR
jgi:hypothetical protein